MFFLFCPLTMWICKITIFFDSGRGKCKRGAARSGIFEPQGWSGFVPMASPEQNRAQSEYLMCFAQSAGLPVGSCPSP